MRVGIIAAMEQEVGILRSRMKMCTISKYGDYEIYSGTLCDIEVYLLKSGVGKVSAAIGTTFLLDKCRPDIIINTGSAAGVDLSLSIGDIVISSEVRSHDVNVTGLGYALGQMPGYPVSFKADEQLAKLAKRCAIHMGMNVVSGLICSGDVFINNAIQLAKIRSDFVGVSAIEMEASAVAQACYAFKTPFVVIRAISDNAGNDSHISFDKFLTVASQHSSEVVEAMLGHL